MDAPRLLCLLVPDFPVLAVPAEDGRPVAVIRGGRIVALDALARRLGLSEAQTPSQARATVSDLAVHAERPDEDRRAWEDFLREAGSLSPIIESPEPGLAYADLRGLQGLFGDEGPTAARFGELLARRGWPRRMACADTRFAAYVAAGRLRNEGCRALPPGRDGAFLAPLPVELLPWSDEDLRCLADLGIRRLGDLAALDDAAFLHRFGEELGPFLAMARGRSLGPLRPCRLPETTEERIALGGRITRGQALVFRLGPALERVVQRLAAQGLACMALALHLEPGGERFEAELSRPAPSVRILSDRLGRVLSEAQLSEGAETARIEVLRTAPLPSAQGSLFPSVLAGEGAVAEALSRLERRLGRERVFTPRLVSAHAPEASWEARSWGEKERGEEARGREGVGRPRPGWTGGPGARGEGKEKRRGAALSGPRALRAVHPPRPAMVRLDGGRPRELRAGELAGRVRRSEGPFPLSGSWWSEERFDRVYHDVELEGGEQLRLYLDRPTGRWFLQGIFD